jgi:hypothetical protein
MARELGEVLHFFIDEPGAAASAAASPDVADQIRPAPTAAAPSPLHAALSQLEQPLEPVVEGILGLDTRIDAIARDAGGRAWAILRCEPDRAAARLTEGLAQCSWLEPRLDDWLKLAPELGIRPEAGVGLVLLCTAFDAHTRAAARTLGRNRVRLVTLRPSR